MIASIAFRNFKALRATRVALGPFNLVIGPNGSGKSSLMEAVLRLRGAADAHVQRGMSTAEPEAGSEPAELAYRFGAPDEGKIARLGFKAEGCPGALVLSPEDDAAWGPLRARWRSIRGFVLDHTAMAEPAARASGAELADNGANLAAFLAHLRDTSPDAFSGMTAELLRIMPEFRSIEIAERADGRAEFGLRLVENGLVVPPEMSQGMLYLIAMLALAFAPNPPAAVCIEDVDRGIHPRMLREVRDALYRLSYPASFGMSRPAAQVIITTHSPYFIDLFREHADEVIVSQKQGRAARFERLTDRPDLPELLREGSLGDMWYSGIFGGVPDEP